MLNKIQILKAQMVGIVVRLKYTMDYVRFVDHYGIFFCLSPNKMTYKIAKCSDSVNRDLSYGLFKQWNLMTINSEFNIQQPTVESEIFRYNNQCFDILIEFLRISFCHQFKQLLHTFGVNSFFT